MRTFDLGERADWYELLWRFSDQALQARIDRRRNGSASRGDSRTQVDERQANRLVAYREAYARLSKDHLGNALSLAIRRELFDVYDGHDGWWRADREAHKKETAEVNLRQDLPETDA